MIGTSTPEYIFIRACIISLKLVTPVSVVYTITRVVGIQLPRAPAILETWFVLETLFYTLVYLPRRYYLQAPGPRPRPSSRDDRQELFARVMANTKDLDWYLRKWFLDSPMAEIKQDNIKEWLRWAFFDSDKCRFEHEAELDDYVRLLEIAYGKTFEQGRGNAKCIRLTFDKVKMTHRCLIWYLVRNISRMLATADTLNRLCLWSTLRHQFDSPSSGSSIIEPQSENSSMSSPSAFITQLHDMSHLHIQSPTGINRTHPEQSRHFCLSMVLALGCIPMSTSCARSMQCQKRTIKSVSSL